MSRSSLVLSHEPEAVVHFANARLVAGGEVVRGTLSVQGRLIASVDQGRAAPRSAIDCEGHLLAPALVELHTDNLERHLTPRPGVEWPVRLAIAAHDAEMASVGIGTVFDSLRVGSLRSDDRYAPYALPLARAIAAVGAEGGLRVAHELHLRAELCSETLAEELAAFGPDLPVRLLSVMDHAPGQRQFRDPDRFETYVRGRYAMDADAFAAHLARLRAISAAQGARNEAEALAHARRLGAILASHDDTTRAQVARSARHGAAMAEFPTTLEAARACRQHGIRIVAGAPNLIRGGSHSGNVPAEALLQEGLLDILSSDYVPSSLLAAAIRIGDLLGDRAAGLATVTSAPAAAAALGDRGRLEAGCRADLVLIREDGAASAIAGHWHAGRRIA